MANKSWIVLPIFFATTRLFISTVSAEQSNSACFGLLSTNATKLYINCGNSGVIQLVNVTAGAKATSTGCPSAFTDADSQDIACCSPSSNPGDDCEFGLQDIADYETACNGQQSCEPEAKNEASIGHCTVGFAPFSLIMYIYYECIDTSVTPSEDNDVSLGTIAGIAAGLGVVLILTMILGAVYYIKVYKKATSCSKVAPEVVVNEADDSRKLQRELEIENV